MVRLPDSRSLTDRMAMVLLMREGRLQHPPVLGFRTCFLKTSLNSINQLSWERVSSSIPPSVQAPQPGHVYRCCYSVKDVWSSPEPNWLRFSLNRQTNQQIGAGKHQAWCIVRGDDRGLQQRLRRGACPKSTAALGCHEPLVTISDLDLTHTKI